MPASPTQPAAPALQALLEDGTLAGAWALDPRPSSIRLKTKVMGLVPVNGVFREVTGAGTVGPDGQVSGTVTVATASIDTRNARRDRHLRSADFFDSGNHPDITFTTDSIRPSGQGAVVTGTLTVCGKTRPLSLHAAVSVRDDGTVCLDADARINRADFGLTWNAMGLTSMNNTVTVHAVFAAAQK